MMDFGPHHMLSSGLNDFFLSRFFVLHKFNVDVRTQAVFIYIFLYIYTSTQSSSVAIAVAFSLFHWFFYRSFMNERRINADSSRVLSVSVLTTRGCEFKAYLSQGGYKQDDNW